MSQSVRMDDDFLELIDRAFLEGQIDGEKMELVWLWLVRSPGTLAGAGVTFVSGKDDNCGRSGRQ